MFYFYLISKLACPFVLWNRVLLPLLPPLPLLSLAFRKRIFVFRDRSSLDSILSRASPAAPPNPIVQRVVFARHAMTSGAASNHRPLPFERHHHHHNQQQTSPPSRPQMSAPVPAASPPSRRDLKSWWKGFKLAPKNQENAGTFQPCPPTIPHRSTTSSFILS